jgi:hypothetical protein
MKNLGEIGLILKLGISETKLLPIHLIIYLLLLLYHNEPIINTLENPRLYLVHGATVNVSGR